MSTVMPIAGQRNGTAVEWALGPGAVSWEVMRNPAVFVVGMLREAILLTLHLPFAAAATDHDGVHEDPEKRFGTVARYVYSATYGTRADAERVSGFVRRRHAQVVGTEPVTGLPYQANSDYELVLTNVLLSSSFIAAYEAIHGRLSDADRDRYLREQQVGGALLGIRPHHLPTTWAELEAFLARARTTWAAGEQAREILRPFASGEYPPGSVIGDLPAYKRRPVAFLVRALTDMALSTMRPEERELLSIDRRPTLGSRAAVRLSLAGLSRWLGSPRGRVAFDKLLKADVAKIVHRALAAEAMAGGRVQAAATFTIPDPAPLVVELENRVENMP